MQVHKRKGLLKLPCSLSRQGKIVNVIQHTRSRLSIYLAAICFCFHQSTMRIIYCVWQCFYNCDVV